MSGSSGTPAELDAVRRLVLDRAKEVRLTLADLSRHIRKNESYMHQFIWRGTPKKLPEDIRKALADILDIPEESLKAPSVLSGIPAAFLPPKPTTLAPPAAATGRELAATPRDVPVFKDNEVVDPTKAQEWTYRPPSLITAGGCFALWISHARGRLRAGDLAFVRPQQPPRVGDIVILMTEDRRVVAAGDLVDMDTTHIKILDTGERAQRLQISNMKLMKVSDITLP